jgi:hypothetical protein
MSSFLEPLELLEPPNPNIIDTTNSKCMQDLKFNHRNVNHKYSNALAIPKRSFKYFATYQINYV